MTAKRGRPRRAGTDADILDAVATLLQEHGYHGLTMDLVARRAGVAKTTVYRRWPAKQELVLATMAHLTTDLAPADTGSLRGDLLLLVTDQMKRLVDGPFGATVQAMQLAVSEKPELSTVAAEGFLADRRREVDVIIDRAIARGELQPGVDREIVFDLCIGALFMRFMVVRTKLTPELPQRIVDAVLLGYPNLSVHP